MYLLVIEPDIPQSRQKLMMPETQGYSIIFLLFYYTLLFLAVHLHVFLAMCVALFLFFCCVQTANPRIVFAIIFDAYW